MYNSSGNFTANTPHHLLSLWVTQRDWGAILCEMKEGRRHVIICIEMFSELLLYVSKLN